MEIIKLLIHAEANIIKYITKHVFVYLFLEDGRRLLWAACRYGYVEIAKVLIDAVSNVNESGL